MQAQGALSQVLAQRETTFKTLPGTIASKKIYFTKCSLAFTQEFVESLMIRGAVRHPTAPSRGNTDVAGDIITELNANTLLFFAALGSMETAGTGHTVGSALTTPTAVIDDVNGVMTVTSVAHGLVAGDSVEITGITAPTSLNDKLFAVFAAPTADTFKVAVPIGTTTTFTLGTGAVKKVTAAGTTHTHTLKAGGGLPSYTIEKGFTDIDQYFKYAGCKCGRLSFGIPNAGMIELSTSWLGGSEATGTSSFETGTPVDNSKRVFDGLGIAAANVKEGGNAIATIKSVDSIVIDNALDGDTFVVGGAGARGAINPGVYGISGSITCLFEDMSIYTKAKALTESSLDFTLTRGAGDGTDNDEYFQVVTPELIFVPKAPAIDGPKGVLATYDFRGYYDNHADATALKIIIKNAILPGALI